MTFVDVDGNQQTVAAEDGETVMQVAVRHGIRAIVAECGGAGACGTCHGYVDGDWFDRLEPPAKAELDMLEYVINPTEQSRLTCQIEMSPILDGLVVHLPSRQY